MNENEFVWYKYFSAKVLMPLISMLLWAFLIYQGKLVGDKMVFGVGGGLLMFCGVLSAQSVLEAFMKRSNNEKEVK